MLSISQPLNAFVSEFRSRLSSHLEGVPSVGDEQIKAALDLAYFILPDQRTASSIASSALSQVEIAFSAQYRRKYYSPTGRSNASSKQKLRNKVLMSRLQLLQRLVYAECEPFEIEQERDREAGLLDEEDMIIRFIKHLIRITVRHNSFYVTVGISRLLHSFNTAETMHIYSLVVQDPDRVKDDSYYRSRKAELMREIFSRFGSLVKEVRGARGEARLEADDKSGERIALVRKALEMFTPWGTRCVMPERFDPDFDELAELFFNGERPDEEHPIEMKRMHSIIDPLCFSRMTSALRYGSPEQRLTVPRFNIAKRGGQGMSKRGDRFNPPELSDEGAKAIWREVAEQKARRKRVSRKMLKVRVDWKEVGRLESGKESRVKFEVSKWAEMIRVYAEDEKGELVVAVYLLDYCGEMEEGEIEECSVEMEGGGRIIFEVKVRSDRYGEYDGAEVEVGYEEKSAVEAAREYLKEVGYGRGPFIKRTKERNEPGRGMMYRRFAFGEMSAKATTGDKISTRQVLSDRLRISLARFYQHSSRIITKQALLNFAENLTALAVEAYFQRDLRALECISQALISLPLPEQYQSVGFYYRALCIKWQGRFEEAQKILEEVERSASLPYRAKSLQSLGAIAFVSGDYQSSSSLFLEVARFPSNKDYQSYLTIIDSNKMITFLKSIEGDHQTALQILENLIPLVRFVSRKYPLVWHDFQNSLAVELMEVGRLQEARQACNIALASPFIRAYPEWQETALDLAARLREPSRSFASVSKSQKLNAPAAPRQEQIRQPNNGPTKVISINSAKTPIRVSDFESKPALSAPASVLHLENK